MKQHIHQYTQFVLMLFSRSHVFFVSSSGLTMIFPLISAPIVARLYTPSDFGIYAVFFSMATIMSTVSTLELRNVTFLEETREGGALLVIFILGVGYFMQTEAFESLTTKTWFAVFFVSGGEFSSWASRLAVLSSFSDQFAVSPIFGNFKAEVVAGMGEGYYVHSVPLSFLTHMGLIGTPLFFLTFFLLLRNRTLFRSGRDLSEIHMGRMMWIVLGVGTISTFLSRAPILFMMGALCKRPIVNG